MSGGGDVPTSGGTLGMSATAGSGSATANGGVTGDGGVLTAAAGYGGVSGGRAAGGTSNGGVSSGGMSYGGVSAGGATTLGGARGGAIVTVDFGSVVADVSYLGTAFIQVDYKNITDDTAVTSLKIQRARQGWVGAFENYDTIRTLGIPSQEIVVSDLNATNLSWTASAEEIARRATDNGQTFIYDLFNEPDSDTTDFPTINDFYAQWDAVYEAIRSVHPSAQIAGPSYSGPANVNLLKAFMNHCKSANTVPDVFAWHFSYPAKFSSDRKDLESYASSIGIGDRIREYSIDENIESVDWQSSSAEFVVQYLANAERARVRMGHAVWNGNEGPFLDGVLSNPDQTQTSQWWAYKVYADMTGSIVSTTPANIDSYGFADYDAVASLDAKGGKAAVLGDGFSGRVFADVSKPVHE